MSDCAGSEGVCLEIRDAVILLVGLRVLGDSSVRCMWLVLFECYEGSLSTERLLESLLPFLVRQGV